MKKMLIPVIVILVGISITTIGSVMAYQILSDSGTVEVLEAITITGDTSFDVLIYPGEVLDVTYGFTNASSVDIKVTPVSSETTGELNLDWDCGNSLTVPGSSTASAILTIEAPKSIVPGVYTIITNFSR